MRYIELNKAPCNQTLEVMTVCGGAGWEKRFESMGIRKGRHIRKIASQPFGGPVVIEVNGSKISLVAILLQKSRWEYLPVPHVSVRPVPLSFNSLG